MKIFSLTSDWSVEAHHISSPSNPSSKDTAQIYERAMDNKDMIIIFIDKDETKGATYLVPAHSVGIQIGG